MTDRAPEPPDEDADLGAPVRALADLREPPPRGFAGRVVGSLRRRHLASQLTSLWWTGLGEVFLELIRLVTGLVSHPDPTDGGDEG